MKHALYKVIGVDIVGPYRLRIRFDDDTVREIDFFPILDGEIFGSLREQSLFEKVQIDPEAHTLVWPNGADFDPATLHDWPRHPEEVKTQLERWRRESETSIRP